MSKIFIENIKPIKARVNKNSVNIMRSALFLVSIDSSRLAPIDKGKLRGEVKRAIDRTINVVTGFFTHRKTYAAIQHERLDFTHKKGGEARFATKALRRNAKKVLKMFADGVLK